MAKIALLFAGQGSQYPGMGMDFYNRNEAAKAAFDRMEKLRPGTIRQCCEGSKEELAITVNTQPCMFAVDYAIAKAVESAGVQVEAVAGFSLGEIPALGFAGLISEEQAFDLVCHRATWMQEAAEQRTGAMHAVVKLPTDVIENLANNYDSVFPVNYNSPEQTAVAGDPEQLKDFAADVKAAGGRTVPLAVSGAFHSPFMDDAAAAMATYTAELEFQSEKCPVYANRTGQPYAIETAAELIATQVNHPVQWVNTILNMQAQGIDCFIEVGPGKTLTGLVKKILPDVQAYKVENMDDLQFVITEVLQA